MTYQVVHAQPRGCVEFYGVSGLSIGLHSNGRPAYLGQVCEGDDAVVPPLKDVTALRATYQSRAALRVFFCPADENPLGFSDLEGGAAYQRRGTLRLRIATCREFAGRPRFGGAFSCGELI